MRKLKEALIGIFLLWICIGGGIVILDNIKYPRLFMLIPKLLFIYIVIRTIERLITN